MMKGKLNFVIGMIVGMMILSTTGVASAVAEVITATRNVSPIYVDGERVEVTAYTIGGYNYFKLRDLGELVDFGVEWDAATASIHIDTNASYSGEAKKAAQGGTVVLPKDGSRYEPKVGDVLQCDDGTTYEITDVSRWDKNAFAAGPLGDLPAATCDWPLLDQPALPAPEVRHFSIEGKEYCFVRNLYETRRMLYTLYNAVGANPETWKDGAPVLSVTGKQMVRFQLSVPKDLNAFSIWPWNEENLVSLFNSCPFGTFYIESWDVYKDGVFQKTQYDIVAR